MCKLVFCVWVYVLGDALVLVTLMMSRETSRRVLSKRQTRQYTSCLYSIYCTIVEPMFFLSLSYFSLSANFE